MGAQSVPTGLTALPTACAKVLLGRQMLPSDTALRWKIVGFRLAPATGGDEHSTLEHLRAEACPR